MDCSGRRKKVTRKKITFSMNIFELIGVELCEPKNNKTMKKLLLSLVAAVSAVFLLPQSAEARGCSSDRGYTYVSGRTNCGCPIYTKRVLRYYDCHGQAVYAYHRQPVTHGCRQHQRGHRHSSSYRSNNSRSSQFSYVSQRGRSILSYSSGRGYRSNYRRCR